MKRKEKPGVMLYFDVMDGLRMLSDEQAGRMLFAIMAYGKDGTEPDFRDDPYLALVWSFIQPKVDRDDEAYREKREQNRRAAQIRWQRERENADACTPMQNMPTTPSPTASSPISSSSSSPSSITSSASASAPPSPHASASAQPMLPVPGYEEDWEQRRREAIRRFDAALGN